jgi:hypothetical protein
MIPRVALVVLMLANVSVACKCRETTASHALEHSDIVFRGTVVEVRDVEMIRDVAVQRSSHNFAQRQKQIVVFRVTRVWKGDVTESFEMPVMTGTVTSCSGDWNSWARVGNDLLVFSVRWAPGQYGYSGGELGYYVTQACSHTGLAHQKSKDFQELGQGIEPKKAALAP